jgi:hypothetical protein
MIFAFLEKMRCLVNIKSDNLTAEKGVACYLKVVVKLLMCHDELNR